KQKVHAVRLAPCHQRLASEAGITTEQNARLRPAASDPGHDPGDLLDRTGRGIDVGPPQLGRQQMTAAEDVERQVAVAVVVAVEEPAFLVAMQRIVRRIEIENDLRRWAPMRLKEHVNEQRLDRRRIVAHLVIPRRFKGLSSSRFSVDLPASGAQSERFAASLPARTASTGSCRSSSWSFRSS